MNKGSIVERLCSDLDRKEPRYKSPTLLYLLYFTLLVCDALVDCYVDIDAELRRQLMTVC